MTEQTTEHTAEELAALAAARRSAQRILDDLADLTVVLQRLVLGRADERDVRVLRGEIAADGSLFAPYSRMQADWDLLCRHRATRTGAAR